MKRIINIDLNWVIKMFGFGNKKKKKDSKDTNKVSSTLINVKVFSALGGDLRTLKASYSAVEQRNDFGELVSINDKFNHDQDVDFYMESIYREMQVLLDFRSKSSEQKTKTLNSRIHKQEKLIFYLDKVPELNAFYNYQDEWAKLRDYRILRNYLKIDEHGSYFYIDGGVRTYEFDAIDGFLIPRWHGNDTYSSYPDHTRTKKIKIQEDLIFQREMASRRFDIKLMGYAGMFFLANMILLGVLGYGYYLGYDKLSNIDNEAIMASKECLQNTVDVNNQFSSIIKDNFDFRKRMLMQNITLQEEHYVESEKKGNLIEKTINNLNK